MAGTTIDKFDINVYIDFAQRTEQVAEIIKQYGLEQAASIPPQILISDYFPKLSEMDQLFGGNPVTTPWAMLLPPRLFRTRRRSPFSVSRIIPSLGTTEDHENLQINIGAVKCDTAEEEREKAAILACFSQMDEINGWLGHIIGRIHQFLQG